MKTVDFRYNEKKNAFDAYLTEGISKDLSGTYVPLVEVEAEKRLLVEALKEIEKELDDACPGYVEGVANALSIARAALKTAGEGE
jgi:hypothetical protein